MSPKFPGLLMISLGAMLWFLKIRLLGVGLLFSGLVFLVSKALYLRKPMTDKVIDERVERINEKTSYYAFWILVSSLAVAIASSWYFELEALCFVGIYCFFILRYYFSRSRI